MQIKGGDIADIAAFLLPACRRQCDAQSKIRGGTVIKIVTLLTNQNYLACLVAALLFIVTADTNHLRDSINYGLQAVFDAEG
ncbi:hypothetical protein IS506_15730 [Serratia marcescens]|uniref:hypothetical protein n=1 Tax=Serratia marcescens TaxID=615 RepID=UPI00188D1991|nr:hypothetical protein [Serratia marcescens]MBF4654529.1 hypothetical protein [Serratia marcescens]MBF8218623.1 hypothetical protein [Serratia ureilytica]MBF8244206.1 hypothetical protein [Serratia ureilytica]